MKSFDADEIVFLEGQNALKDSGVATSMDTLDEGWYVGRVIKINDQSHHFYDVLVVEDSGMTWLVTVATDSIQRFAPAELKNPKMAAQLAKKSYGWNVTEVRLNEELAKAPTCCDDINNRTKYVSLMGKHEVLCKVCGKTHF